ncbi:GNAT family N-acetyltransferase [Lentzea tibetensis]|uniref:GNAT family N-acetyltransferase n=1 Tax=Lentzea tibetensis TaxID=2591470 RepID=A0A563ET75_9PSEU|nr:GNAT family N-acetyltransferase [Lentzea tibetensis]TWP50935.1 GNAT family N-acetyltransferase [Lentzea tibetensis]
MLINASALDEATLREVRDIYEDGFGARLRAPFADLLADEALVLMDSHPQGLAVLRPLGPTGWVFLRYFVAASRGNGAGTRLWHAITAHLAARYSRIVYDVEDPAEHDTAPAEVVIRERRIAFYERLGAQLLPVRDYLPPHGDDTHPMLLMAANLGAATDPAGMDPIDVPDLVRGVYLHRYGLPAHDPVVQRTLSALPTRT